jgi:hypothetical protein
MGPLSLFTLAPAGEDPFEVFHGLGPKFGILLLLVPVALVVVWYARKMAYASRSEGGRAQKRPDWADAGWRAKVAELEAADPTPIAKASKGPVRFVATIASAPEHLGGPSGRQCVWRNQAGGDADTAIGSELVFVADASGRAAIEGLEHARVIAPVETIGAMRGRTSGRREHVALYVGDEVEIYGRFAPEKVGDDPDATKLVYGTLGTVGPIEIRLRTRPERATPEPPAPATNDAAPAPAADAHDEGSPP